MLKKISVVVVSVALGVLLVSPRSYGQNKTTTVEVTTETTTRTAEPRQLLSENTLRKISNTLCARGFKAYVGSDDKNVCKERAFSPNIAYSCVWQKSGAPVYAPTNQGPCSLDYSEHRGSIIITKEKYASYPPLKYGAEAQCCYRSAEGSLAAK